MKRVGIGLALICAALYGLVINIRADDANKEQALRSRLVGTWRMVTAKFGGNESELPKLAITYKHVTPEGFMWLSHEKDTGKVFRAAGGTYTLHGDAYTEKIEYGMGDDFNVVKNAQHPFTCKIEGDKWFHTGKLANGLIIEEVWERVKPVETGKAP